MTSQPRIAIVTGAGKRVGAVLTRALIEDGWVVIGHVRSEADELPLGATKVTADLADPYCVERIFDAVPDGMVASLLVNNAARFAWDGFGHVSVEEFDRHMAVNVRAPMLLTDRFAAAQPKEGMVVNLLDAKLSAPNPDFLSYTLSKHALGGLTELSARALAPRGIRVNGIAPALMLQSRGQSLDNFKAMHSANPLGRGVTPEDVAAALRYLIGTPTVTGQILTLDGGQRFWSLDRDVQFLEAKT